MTIPATNTALERAIRSQPEELERLLRVPVHHAVEGLHRARRIWLVGTGSSQHAAELGAAMLNDAGRAAQAVPAMQFVDFAPVVGPRDAVVVITHTAETAFALAARSLAIQAGLGVVSITRRGVGFADAVETVDRDPAETYTVSYTAALLILARIASEMGATTLRPEALARVPEAVARAIEDPGISRIPIPARSPVLVGAGPAAVTAREGALKLREGARMLAEGFDVEYLLHGNAVPLGGQDRLLVLAPPADPHGLLEGVARAAAAEGIPVSRLEEPSDLPPLLAQIPLTVRLQLLTLRFAVERGQDPDTVIVGAWADPELWRLGAPPG
jgi:glucosamine--fructose-6-phosphate aminotransferase (isomerizing)